MVVIKFFGIPQMHLDKITIPLDDMIFLRDLMAKSKTSNQNRLTETILKNDILPSNIYILLNGRRIDDIGGLDAIISPGDILTINKLLTGG